MIDNTYASGVDLRTRKSSASVALQGVTVAEDACCDAANRAGFLDDIVANANRVNLFGLRYRPYWIMSDIAGLSAFAYAWAFSRRFPGVSGIGLILAILAALLVYKLVLEAKAALGKPAARSFLQDCLLIIIPCFLLVSVLFKQPTSLSLAFLGTLLPLYGCLARIGCFLGGCCYGKPSEVGILWGDSRRTRIPRRARPLALAVPGP